MSKPKKGKDERTLKMMENYVKHWQDGMTPHQIAKHYGFSYSLIYKYLGEIAEKAGYQRKQLLEKPHSEHRMSGIRVIKGDVEKVDAQRFEEQLEIVGREINTLQSVVNGSIKRGEDFEVVCKEA
ncbi:hypothetical protein IK110_03215 [Candidatus Saccharibacteria bacterium]|nr:hypothetical protein [Candidatus Saccharibacteria bacterium]